MVLAIDNFLTASLGLSVKVPFLGLGMRPRGPKTRAKGRSLGMVTGVATRMSKLILPSLISAKIASFRTAIF